MTRTLRAYNKHPLRLGPGYCGWITSNRIPEQNLFKYIMADYHPWQQWGFMRGWKDWRLRSRRRQSWKRELRMLTEEYARYGLFTGDSPYDFCDRNSMELFTHDSLAELVDIWYDYLDDLNPAIDDWYY